MWHVRTHSNETRRRLCVLVQPAYSRRMTIRIYLNEPNTSHTTQALRSTSTTSIQLKPCANKTLSEQRCVFCAAQANVSSLLILSYCQSSKAQKQLMPRLQFARANLQQQMHSNTSNHARKRFKYRLRA